jgi:hypothetical protein
MNRNNDNRRPRKSGEQYSFNELRAHTRRLAVVTRLDKRIPMTNWTDEMFESNLIRVPVLAAHGECSQ